MAIYRVKNWHQFQHYKDRSPPWVKLHRALLDDFKFSSLPLASKALAPLLWLLAAENMKGEVECDPEWLAFRLRWSVRDTTAGVTALIDKGFLESASGVLADRAQPATPETETDTENTLGRQADRFSEFWELYPKKVGKKPAGEKWRAKKLNAKADEILADVRKRSAADRRWLEGFIPNPATYLTQERWQDEIQGATVPPTTHPASGKPKGPSETPLERAVAWARQQHAYGAIDEAERDRLIAVATAKHRGDA